MLKAFLINQEVILINIYAPNQKQHSFYFKKIRYVFGFFEDKVICDGDSKRIINPEFDRQHINKRLLIQWHIYFFKRI